VPLTRYLSFLNPTHSPFVIGHATHAEICWSCFLSFKGNRLQCRLQLPILEFLLRLLVSTQEFSIDPHVGNGFLPRHFDQHALYRRSLRRSFGHFVQVDNLDRDTVEFCFLEQGFRLVAKWTPALGKDSNLCVPRTMDPNKSCVRNSRRPQPSDTLALPHPAGLTVRQERTHLILLSERFNKELGFFLGWGCHVEIR